MTNHKSEPGFILLSDVDQDLIRFVGEDIAMKVFEEKRSHDGYCCPWCLQRVALADPMDRAIMESSEDMSVERACERCGGDYIVHVYVRRHLLSSTANAEAKPFLRKENDNEEIKYS